MPEPLWIYLMALLYFTNLTSCSAMADACDSVSHEQVTRMLQGSWSGHRLFELTQVHTFRSLPLRCASRELFQQGFGLLEVGGIKALGEPAIDGCQQLISISALVLALP